MTRVATIQPDVVARHHLSTPCVIGGVKDFVAVKIIELARSAIFCNLFVFPCIDRSPDIRTIMRQLRKSSLLIRSIGKVHPKILTYIFYQLNFSKVIKRSNQRIARYLSICVLHLCHSMWVDILIVREVAHSCLEENVAVWYSVFLFTFFTF